VILGQIAILTSTEGRPIPVLAPSMGTAVVWFSTSSRGTLRWDVPALTVGVWILAFQLGTPAWVALITPVASLATVATFTWAMRTGCPDLVPFGTGRRVWSTRDLAVFGTATLLASLVGSASAAALHALAGLPFNDLETFFVRWGRNATMVMVAGSIGLLALAAWADEAGESQLLTRIRQNARQPGRRARELAALIVASTIAYVVAFDVLDAYPVAFLLFALTAWAGSRFSPLVTAVHSAFVGTIAVAFTFNGRGIFAVVSDPILAAMLVQMFVIVLVSTGLLIAVTTNRLAAAELLAEQRARLFDDVLNDVADGVLVLGLDGELVFVNRAAQQALGPTQVEMTDFGSSRPYTLHWPDGRAVPDSQTPFARALAGASVSEEEFHLVWSDGRSPRVIRLSAHQMPTPHPSEPQFVLVSFHDITEDHRRRDALAKFAGHVAHDLQNPLTVVSTWTELLQQSFEDHDSVTAAQGLPSTNRVLQATARMRDFIRELLDYTVARDQTLQCTNVDLAALAEDVAALRRDFGSHRSDSPPTITVEGSGSAWVDPQMLRIVIDNLVSNAVKFVAPGVTPQVVVSIQPAGPGWVTVAVTDNGIGIIEDQRARIFDSFVRLDNGDYAGTGLGLGICHRIVTRHGGEITVSEAEDSGGARVEFRVPVLPLDADPANSSLWTDASRTS
jgi:PAS domain S-box-containing protein